MSFRVRTMSLRELRQWMYEKNLPGRCGVTNEFINGVKEFIDFASGQHDTMDGELIRCPCVKCGNLKFFEPDEVAYHLVRKGFTENYFN